MFKPYFFAIFVLFFMGFVSAANASQGLEIEPNDTCETAQDFSGKAYPFVVSGKFKSESDIDFFKFTAKPKSLVKMDMKVAIPIAIQTYYGNCNDFINIDLVNSSVLRVPDNGQFIVIVSQQYGFTNRITPYTLSIASANEIGSITGELFDSNTQQLLNMEDSYANLYRCTKAQCDIIGKETANAQGLVTFTKDSSGRPLVEASYKIVAGSKQYESSETPLFYVAKNQHKRVDVPVKSYPLRISVSPCKDLPSKGGNCKFSVTVTNGQAKAIKATLWNIAQNEDMPLPTMFPIGSAPITLPKIGAKTILNFSFFIPASLASSLSYDAYICVSSYVGAGNDMGFNLLGTSDDSNGYPGFCFLKESGKNTLTAVSDMRPKLAKRRLNYSPRR